MEMKGDPGALVPSPLGEEGETTDAPRSPPETPSSRQDGQDRSKIALRGSPDRFPTPQDRPKKAQERPRSPQERPRGLLEPSWGHLAAFRSHLVIKKVLFFYYVFQYFS